MQEAVAHEPYSPGQVGANLIFQPGGSAKARDELELRVTALTAGLTQLNRELKAIAGWQSAPAVHFRRAHPANGNMPHPLRGGRLPHGLGLATRKTTRPRPCAPPPGPVPRTATSPRPALAGQKTSTGVAPRAAPSAAAKPLALKTSRPILKPRPGGKRRSCAATGPVSPCLSRMGTEEPLAP